MTEHGPTIQIRSVSARIGGIGAKHLKPRGEIRQFIQRALHRRILWVALDIRVELRRGERPADHIAFQLGHVDAIRGKTAHRLVQGGGDVAHLKDERGHHAVLASRGAIRFWRHDKKAGGIGAFVLDMPGQHVQPIDLTRQLRGQRRQLWIAHLRHFARGPGGIRTGDTVNALLCQKITALTQEHCVAHRAFDLAYLRTRQAEQIYMHPHKRLSHDMQAG